MLEDAIRAAAKVDGHGRADIIKVAATSRANAVAGAIAGIMRVHKLAEVQAIGAGAVNQAVKAMEASTIRSRVDRRVKRS